MLTVFPGFTMIAGNPSRRLHRRVEAEQSRAASRLSSRWSGTRDRLGDLDAMVSFRLPLPNPYNPLYMMNISVLRHSWKLPSEFLVDETNLAVF